MPTGVSYLTAGLTLVLLAALLDFLIVTFQGAVVLQKVLEILKEILQIVILLLALPRKGYQVGIQRI